LPSERIPHLGFSAVPGLALDTLNQAAVIECQVVPASAAKWEENLVTGIRESREDFTFSPVSYEYWISHTLTVATL
jgi:hypothetical protein